MRTLIIAAATGVALIAPISAALAGACTLNKATASRYANDPERLAERQREQENSSVCKVAREREARENERAKEHARRRAAEGFVEPPPRTPDWTKPDPAIGMTAEQVTNATNHGAPNQVHQMTTADGTDEQWFYEQTLHIPRGYLYFHNGVLVAIQH